MNYLLVFLGGGLGSAVRHAVNRASLALLGPSFPAGTLFVNVVGGFLMGAAAGWLLGRGGHEPMRLFLVTGVLGGFTTFSAFSLDAVILWERGDHALGATYVSASVVLAIAGLVGGMAAVRGV